VNGGTPQIGTDNAADALARQFIASRTQISRVPTDLYAARAALAGELAEPIAAGPSAAKTVSRFAVALDETFEYRLSYAAGDDAHTVTISDTVPDATTVVGATGSKAPAPLVDGQVVTWTVPVVGQETVTLTIEARGASEGTATNTATFSGSDDISPSTLVIVGEAETLYLPLVQR
jgi:hypothetical protein